MIINIHSTIDVTSDTTNQLTTTMPIEESTSEVSAHSDPLINTTTMANQGSYVDNSTSTDEPTNMNTTVTGGTTSADGILYYYNSDNVHMHVPLHDNEFTHVKIIIIL